MTTEHDAQGPSDDALRHLIRFSYRMARNLGCDHYEADDVSQKTTIRLVRVWDAESTKRARETTASWNSFIAVATRNVYRSEIKSRTRRVVRENDYEGHYPDLPPSQVLPIDPSAFEQYLARTRVLELSADLSGRQRECVELRYIEGMKVVGIAEYLDIPPDQVRTHLRRAHEHIRRKLEAEAAEVDKTD